MSFARDFCSLFQYTAAQQCYQAGSGGCNTGGNNPDSGGCLFEFAQCVLSFHRVRENNRFGRRVVRVFLREAEESLCKGGKSAGVCSIERRKDAITHVESTFVSGESSNTESVVRNEVHKTRSGACAQLNAETTLAPRVQAGAIQGATTPVSGVHVFRKEDLITHAPFTAAMGKEYFRGSHSPRRVTPTSFSTKTLLHYVRLGSSYKTGQAEPGPPLLIVARRSGYRNTSLYWTYESQIPPTFLEGFGHSIKLDALSLSPEIKEPVAPDASVLDMSTGRSHVQPGQRRNYLRMSGSRELLRAPAIAALRVGMIGRSLSSTLEKSPNATEPSCLLTHTAQTENPFTFMQIPQRPQPIAPDPPRIFPLTRIVILSNHAPPFWQRRHAVGLHADRFAKLMNKACEYEIGGGRM
ncbi:hypothetical protein BGY98DRAFT_939785 [Russula aff. rugulosa BPL654]|nr:hypothetical protein BGY98DRAFT_939785 [Russula aff. rugulosa BPL654]